MHDGWLRTLKRFILWDYTRGCLQYDIMCAIILAFIFLTPAEVFRDQPKAQSVVMLPGEAGSTVFWIEPELLDEYPEADRDARVQSLIKSQARGRRFDVTRVEPIFDSEEEIKGYMAFASAAK